MPDFDVIVIGAGNGGLTAAATAQRGGLRTLLVERHNVPGGCATSFRRGRFEFEVALHQLSGVGQDGQPFSLRDGLFSQLGIADRVEFIEEHELYRAVIPGVCDLILPADWDGLVEVIEEHFPGNRANAEAFFDLVRTVAMWQVSAMRGMPAEDIDARLFSQGLRPLAAVLTDHFPDPVLRNALGAYWVYLGDPPSSLPFQDFALTFFAYVQFKPWHIRGGSQALSAAILDVFLEAGGQVMFNTGVEHIHTENGRVCGVTLETGEQISAPEVISNASPHATFTMLGSTPDGAHHDLLTRRIGLSAFVLHMGLDTTATDLGFTAATTFVNRDADDERTFASWQTLEPTRAICMSNYDVNPIGFSPPGTCHVSLVTLQAAAAWDDVAPQDYARTKFAYADTMIDLAEKVIPGIREVIEEVDVATPMTMMRYLAQPDGAIYGYRQGATDSWLFRARDLQDQVPGLSFAGAWEGFGGFQPTLESGARAARRVLRGARV
jgi:phytoene dehydrogenase-like protein